MDSAGSAVNSPSSPANNTETETEETEDGMRIIRVPPLESEKKFVFD